ncbi:MAG: hypothetical protein AB7E49_07950 [Campylobacterales bacterium]
MAISATFKSLLFPFLRIAHVGIAVAGNKANLLTRTYQNRRVVKEERREFDMIGGHPSQMMFDYLQKVEKSHTYAYVATALSSINQGAIPSCDKAFFKKLHVDTENILTLCRDESWSIYGSLFDIEEILRNYEPVEGLDFVFPTESIVDHLRNKFSPQIAPGEAVAFLLYDRASATLCVYQGGVMSYSSHFVFDEDEEGLIEEDQTDVSDLLDDALDENDIQEEIVELDSIGDGDDLDSIEDLNDFIASDDSLNFDSAQTGDTASDAGLSAKADDSFFDEEPQSNLRRDMLLFNFIKNSINDFYKNENFESSFITRSVIFDTHDGAKGIGRFLKEELYIESVLYDADMSLSVCELSVLEANE